MFRRPVATMALALVLTSSAFAPRARADVLDVAAAVPARERPARVELRLGLPRFIAEPAAPREERIERWMATRSARPFTRLPRVRIEIGDERAAVSLVPPARALAQLLDPTAERGSQWVRADEDLGRRLEFDLRAGISIKADAQIRLEAMYGVAFRGSNGGGPDEVLAAFQGTSDLYLRHGPWVAVRIDF